MSSRCTSAWPVAALAWILAACPKAPPPPPEVTQPAAEAEEEDDSAKVSEQLHQYEEERAEREHPAAECGNGTIDTTLERICAPCPPGRHCPCADAVRPVEDCDGQNLDGQTCRSLGFAGGTLRCSPSCHFDTSACQSPLAAVPSDGEGFSTSTSVVPQGAWTSLAISEGALGYAASAQSTLGFRAYDVRDLAPLESEVRFPTSVAADGTGAFGPVLMAPKKGGFLAAVGQLGQPALSIFAISREGQLPRLQRMGERLRGLEPRFLVEGEGGYLLGGELAGPRHPVQVVALGADGAPRGAPGTAIDAPRKLAGNGAAAAWTGAEYLVASGANASDPAGTLWLAFVGPAGDVRKSFPVSFPAHEVAVLPSGAGAAQILFVGDRALWRVEVLADRTVGIPVKLAEGELRRIVAAEIRDAALSAWVLEGNELHRVRAPLEGGEVSDERIFAGPELAPAGGLLDGGRFYVVLAAKDGSLLYHLR